MNHQAVTLTLITLALVGCSKSNPPPTAPPPDNPTPPSMTCTANWPTTPSTIVLTAPAENLVVTNLWVSVSHPPNGGGSQLDTDLPVGSELRAGVPQTVDITTYAGTSTPYAWQQGDAHVVRVTVNRSGQSTHFTLYLLRD
ncbi:MAG: hypothetical protein HYR74_09030 [Candidatus Eisenbacteria bacterium]|nr:hypothetical protein [Candidatus Eisenbacteria bacterium]